MSSDYGGLGIVLEEREPTTSHIPEQLHKNSISSITTISTSSPLASEPVSRRQSQNNTNTNEILLVAEKLIGTAATNIGPDQTQIPEDILNTTPILANEHHSESSTTIQEKSAIETETLLPPLPDDSSDLITHSTTLVRPTLHADTTSISASNSLVSPITASAPLLSNSEDNENNVLSCLTSNNTTGKDNGDASSLQQSDLSEFLQRDQPFSNYELDSPSLHLDTSNFQIFPSLNQSNSSSVNGSVPISTNNSNSNSKILNSNTNTNTNSGNNTSPLKRLKSLKNGIRKLSLSSSNNNNSSNSLPPPSVPHVLSVVSNKGNSPAIRPLVTPLQDEFAAPLAPNHHSNQHSHSSTSSSSNSSVTSGLNPTKGKRSRTLSNSAMLTPVTPPLSSPIITISENLSGTKQTLSNIEQNYFDVLNSKFTSTVFSGSQRENHAKIAQQLDNEVSFESEDRRGRVNSISELTQADELINFANYINKQKQSMSDAFDLTRKHLMESGWCSDHDLNNLQLQQDSSMSQLDTKLLQVEEKLNREFSISILHDSNNDSNSSISSTSPKKKLITSRTRLNGSGGAHSPNNNDLPISPSLKVLESRCFSFADI
ncbi:uncharacterized protein RJT21DRAFT_16607 [Scheffersomyces amazonensis]|uniref:uncharacterized protein n=1 Tax=Scheffersomyces amazonensis TaxID=1078765 RepID=UPI00315DACDD